MNNIKIGGSVGVGSLLTIVFVVLRLTDNVTWSWWWVLAPTWIPFVLALLIAAFALAMAALVAWLDGPRSRRRRRGRT